ncbi:hypothetical protein PVAR5_6809 [Paecilomyces variotii No. 5]|uniref:Uncharacterized protein n=1 Tax=Byssochlamys spectabilis (strain No. 5 / NBRC 109023) TaxID=1356009 RepID=V5FJT3_BYSSN|nr:hypothetical protein PVAR5_6809 [Paecilomyces variotii No. 5]
MDHTSPSESKSYKDFVRFRQQANPCIAGLSKFFEGSRYPPSSCRIHAANYGTEGIQRNSAVFKKVDVTELSHILNTPSPGQRRLIIIEDLHPWVAEVLGSRLDIDPVFFANHVVTKYGGIEMMPAPPSAALAPSQIIMQANCFHLHFQRIVDLGSAKKFRNCGWECVTSGNVPRALRRLPAVSNRQLAILRACCSVFVKSFDRSSIGVIFVDPTTSEFIASSGTSQSQPERVIAVPLHTGVEDFRRPVSFSVFQISKSPIKDVNRSTSLLDVLIGYYSDEKLRPEATDGSILQLVYYPLCVVIGEWILYNQVMARYLSYYEYSLRSIDTIVNDEKGDLIDLQKWRHRAIQSRIKIESTKNFVHYWLSQQNDSSNIWDLILADLDSLSKQVEQYGQSLERIIPVVTSMVQLYDAHRSVTESINVRRLTYVALIFVPLSWVAALFSMADDYGPGKPKFWIYFAVSLPFCMLVFACSFLASLPPTNLLKSIGVRLRSKRKQGEELYCAEL